MLTFSLMKGWTAFPSMLVRIIQWTLLPSTVISLLKVCLFSVCLQIDEYSNRVANLMVSDGYKHGDTVALFMMNQPEYVCTWLGCAKVIVLLSDLKGLVFDNFCESKQYQQL